MIGAAFPQGLFEPTGYAAASVVIWAAVVAGLASRVLPSAPIGRTAAFAGICLAATAVLAVASVSWASDQGRAFEEAVRVSFYLGLFSLAATTASRGGRTEWIAGLTIGLAAVSVVAVVAYLQPGLLGTSTNDIPNAAGRLSYPVGYWNAAAALLAVAAVLLANAGVRAPSRGLRCAATAAIPVAGLGIWLASSRGGAIAAGIGLAVLLAASASRWRQLLVILAGAAGSAALILIGHRMHSLTSGTITAAKRSDGDWMTLVLVVTVGLTAAAAWLLGGLPSPRRPSRRVALGLGAAAAVLAVAAVVAVNPAERFREFKAAPPTSNGATLGAAGVSSNGRWQFWSAAVDAFESAPVAGLGAGGYEDWWAQHGSVPLFVRNAHSLPLQQAAELGTGGILLLLGFLGACALAARRRLAEGLAGDAGVLTAVLLAGGVGAAIDWVWEIPGAFGAAVICAGLLTASARSRRRAGDGYWLGVGTVATAWVAMVLGGLVVLGELDLRQSEHDAAGARVTAGIGDAERAHTVLPWSSAPYTQLALLEEQRGNYDAALAYLRSAERRDSQDWRLPLIEARLQQRRGDAAAARTAIARARSLSPALPVLPATPPSQG